MLKLKLQYFGTWYKEPIHWKRDPDVGKDQEQEKEVTEDEMVGWHHRLKGHEFEQTLGDSEGQGSLAFVDSEVHGVAKSDWANNNKES